MMIWGQDEFSQKVWNNPDSGKHLGRKISRIIVVKIFKVFSVFQGFVKKTYYDQDSRIRKFPSKSAGTNFKKNFNVI